MDHPILQSTPADGRLPPPNPAVVLLVTVLWLAFACAFPLHRVHEARQLARVELADMLAKEKPDQASVLAAFDHSNENVDVAATGPCLLMAVTILFLIRQLLLLKRRYHAAVLDLESQRVPRGDANDDLTE